MRKAEMRNIGDSKYSDKKKTVLIGMLYIITGMFRRSKKAVQALQEKNNERDQTYGEKRTN